MLSVIIPVYNVMDYLEQCVKSVLLQNYDDMEVILVNDCSTDDCGRLCDSLAQLDSRIVVVHKFPNEGLGYARNTGMEYAKGDYFVFVDSDDWLEPDSYRQMMEYMIRDDLDIIQGKMIIEHDNYYYRSEDSNNLYVLSKDEAAESLLNLREITTVACDKIYRAEIFDEIKFSNTRYNEDTEIMYLLLYESDRIGFYDNSFYHYRQRSGSLAHKPVSIDRAMFVIDVCTRRIAFFQDKTQQLYLSARKRSFTRMIGLFYTLDKKQEGGLQFLRKLSIDVSELYSSLFPLLSGKERLVYGLLSRSLKSSIDGIVLRPLVAVAYKKRASRYQQKMRKHRKS